MNRKLTVILAFAAGLMGGILSRYISPNPVLAQAQPAKELRAQSFVLVDEKNNVVGTFKSSEVQPTVSPTIILQDRNGREIWRAGVSMRTLTER